ncbi:hypothetical protein [Micromonospora sp. NPDC005806]|uniref:hypothetical protein n=1 Tax=Micromonospora sp. NPDC005806 TaxID=3364234 RepID=UPI0036AF43C9
MTDPDSVTLAQLADPATVTLSQLRDCFAAVGIDLGNDFVKLELHDDVLIVERLIRSPAGLPVSRPDGGVQVSGVQIAVVADPPPAGG